MTIDAVVDTELRGYSLPLSPSGTSSMLTPPPWYFSGQVVMVEYRVAPDAAARFLPAGLDRGADLGAAAAVWARWQWCSESGEELTDPARCQFNEFLILLSCEYRGSTMARCPYAWVDSPVSMVRGWVQGMPKQFGAIHLTAPMSVGRAAPRDSGAGDFHGAASVFGRLVARASVHVEERVDRLPQLHDVPLVHTRAFPSWATEEPAGSELVASIVDGVEFSEVRAGTAELELHDVLDGDFARLRPVEVGRGYSFSYAETLRGGRLLATDPADRSR